jgi:hypothetical protein
MCKGVRIDTSQDPGYKGTAKEPYASFGCEDSRCQSTGLGSIGLELESWRWWKLRISDRRAIVHYGLGRRHPCKSQNIYNLLVTGTRMVVCVNLPYGHL